MCGIAGYYSWGRGKPDSLLEEMTHLLSHRGPDGQGYISFGSNDVKGHLWNQSEGGSRLAGVGLGNRRLKILDLSANGAQPMSTEDGRYSLTFNGLIYNFKDLKNEFSLSVKSACDTEVLLKVLAQKWDQGLRSLNGIFALAIYDSVKKKLLLARDPVGVKPLYYQISDKTLYFASEIKSLLLISGRPKIRRDLIERYLMNNWIPDPDTMFEGIMRLPPGHQIEVSANGQFQIKPYWDLSYSQTTDQSVSEWTENLRATLDSSLKRQMQSDVPLAFFLSGGIDSSLLAAKASLMPGDKPTAYTIGFEWANSPIDRLDLESARAVARQFNLQHREIMLSPDIATLLPTVVETLEEPIADTAALCSYLICEAAQDEFTVLVSGQGGDELFGGYPVFKGGLAAQKLSVLPKPILALLDSMVNQLPNPMFGRQMQTVQRLKKLFFSAQSRWPEPFLRMRSPIRRDHAKRLLTPECAAMQAAPFSPQLDLFENAKDFDPRHQMLYLDFKTFLPALNLTYTDKTSMKHSVDVRVPLLDLEMIRLMEHVPSSLKFNQRESKILLKEACRGFLPDSIIDRKKAGFGIPLREWLMRDLRKLTEEALSPKRIQDQRIFNSNVVDAWMREHREERTDHSLRLYALLSLELWIEKFNVAV